ncbi:MAG: hypothetical protein GY839_02250 [candidate division Zixibacteria bacterium]|nr:hypothetical protein [candidate division Zixibacteria bacterium]
MYTAKDLMEFHKRTHQSLEDLIAHCRQLSAAEFKHELAGFGYLTVHQQLHHGIGAEKYWIGVLQGRIDVNDNISNYPTVELLEVYRQEVFAATEQYLSSATDEELNTPRPMMTWGNRKKVLMPTHVFMRTLTHLYQHQGQIVAMCRLLGKPVAPGLDYPIT